MSHFQVICLECDSVEKNEKLLACSACGSALGFTYDLDDVSWDDRYNDSMWRYWRLLPIKNPDEIVTLKEGATPLLRSHLYADRQVYFKDETNNPTGSHKDRSLSVAINHARAIRSDISFVVSTGSTGISNAALASQAGMRSAVVMTSDTPIERIYPMFALGSTVIEAHGDVDTLVDEVIKICRAEGYYLSSTSRESNPYQAEGNKPIAYEIVEALGRAPDWMVITVGGGGTLSGIWRGFKEMRDLGKISKLPKLIGVVPEHYNALAIAFKQSLDNWEDVLALDFSDAPPSILVKLAHAYPPDGMEALQAVRESGGYFESVSDEASLDGLQKVGKHEGMYVEPSTSACIPVVDRMIEAGTLGKDDLLVVLMCGSGYREAFLNSTRMPMPKQQIAMADLPETLARAAEARNV